MSDFIFFSGRELDYLKHARVSLLNSIYYLTDTTSFREDGTVRPVARVVPDEVVVSAAMFSRTLAKRYSHIRKVQLIE